MFTELFRSKVFSMSEFESNLINANIWIIVFFPGVEGTPLDNQVIKYTEKIFKLENLVLVQDRTLQTQKVSVVYTVL